MELITIADQSGLGFKIRVRDHSLDSVMGTADEGQDDWASPAELLGCSLAACVAMMVQDYCDRHGHVHGDVTVALTLQLAQQPKRVAAINVDVELARNVPESALAGVDRKLN